MGKLHELLAIEGDLKSKKDKMQEETIKTFTKKDTHFGGGTKQLKMFDEKRSQEDFIEYQEVTTTVKDKLDYMKEAFIQLFDAKLQKEITNQQANNMITIGEDTISGLPVTFLLNMEKELVKLREIFNSIPTLAPGVKWEQDTDKGENIYKASMPIIKKKTEKTIVVIPLAPPTKEFKAQVTTVTEDRPVGDYILERYSGAITPAKKSEYLTRIDKLLIEFKKARQRANNIETSKEQVGEKIFNYILA